MEILDSVYESEGSHKKPGQLAEDRTKIMKKKTWYEGKEMDQETMTKAINIYNEAEVVVPSRL